MQHSQHRAKNGCGENNDTRGMPVLTEDNASQELHDTPKERAPWVAETRLHSFVHDPFSYSFSVVRGQIRPDDGPGGIGRADHGALRRPRGRCGH